MHPRTIHLRKWRQSEAWLRENIDPDARLVKTPPKHRYLMPLDDAMRAQIAPLAKPYPKRAEDQAASHPDALGGETPTRALQIDEAA